MAVRRNLATLCQVDLGKQNLVSKHPSAGNRLDRVILVELR